jgi:hypothetical protein
VKKHLIPLGRLRGYNPRPKHAPKLLALALCVIAGGCDRNEIQVYRVPKETVEVAEAHSAHDGHAHAQETPAVPRLTWTLPAGWEVRPASGMRVASFAIAGADGESAELAVIPLPAAAGQELDLVNMWRGQLELAPVTKDDIGKEAETVSVGSDQAKLFDLAAQKPAAEAKAPLRILVAMLTREGTRWFFKLTGHDRLVREQKSAFVEFLKSVTFVDAPESTPFASAPRPLSTNEKLIPQENSGRPAWVVPPGWQEVSGAQMLVAKFIISGTGGAKAELNVSQLSGTGGGVLPNVNRWRNQLGLGPWSESDLSKQVQSLDVTGGKAMLIDMTGTNANTGEEARLVGAIVPQSDQTWFYKLMGNAQVIERERDVFTRFLQTVKYSNVP